MTPRHSPSRASVAGGNARDGLYIPKPVVCSSQRMQGKQRTTPATMESGAHNLADETGPRTAVCHFPPGTSKWNKIEHRLFSFISKNWRGKPLLSFEVIVNLIAATTTVKGLKVHAEIDDGVYPAGTKIERPNSSLGFPTQGTYDRRVPPQWTLIVL